MKLLKRLTHVNKIILYLTASDVFTWGILWVLSSISGIYLAERLGEDAVKIVGIGTAIYSVVRGISQIPLGMVVDKIKKDTDDIIFLLIGNLLMGIPFLFYPLIESANLYYLLQIVTGIGASANLLTWRKLFATNLDKDNEGKNYGFYELIMSLSIAAFSFTAGSIANISQDYFDTVMIVISIIIMSSSIWPLLILFSSNKLKKQQEENLNYLEETD